MQFMLEGFKSSTRKNFLETLRKEKYTELFERKRLKLIGGEGERWNSLSSKHMEMKVVSLKELEEKVKSFVDFVRRKKQDSISEEYWIRVGELRAIITKGDEIETEAIRTVMSDDMLKLCSELLELKQFENAAFMKCVLETCQLLANLFSTKDLTILSNPLLQDVLRGLVSMYSHKKDVKILTEALDAINNLMLGNQPIIDLLLKLEFPRTFSEQTFALHSGAKNIDAQYLEAGFNFCCFLLSNTPCIPFKAVSLCLTLSVSRCFQILQHVS